MEKTYKGLNNALITARNIIRENRGVSWESLCDIFSKDVFIEPYYFEVAYIVMAGRTSLRFEEEGETNEDI